MTNPSSHSEGGRKTPDQSYVPGLPGRLLSRAYTGVVQHRNRRFDRGKRVVTFDRPVISVGNLSLGGTGKTPTVEKIVELLRAHGHDPAVAMRGYGSKRAGISDEAELYRARFDDLALVAQPRRVEGLIALFGTERGRRVDCVVLDDGFQHRRIARQIDLVLIDASHDPFGCEVFPAGRLREPVANLARATHVVITHAELVSPPVAAALAERASSCAGIGSCAVASHEWSGFTVVHRGRESAEPASYIAGKRVVAACAIGRPAGFLAALERAHADVVETVVLPDHDPFSRASIDRICAPVADSAVHAIVLTRKDWTKLVRRPIDWPCPVAIPTLTVEFRAGWEALAHDILAVAASEPV
jgi:tetraacyldisaccharide 4'-kinase